MVGIFASTKPLLQQLSLAVVKERLVVLQSSPRSAEQSKRAHKLTGGGGGGGKLKEMPRCYHSKRRSFISLSCVEAEPNAPSPALPPMQPPSRNPTFSRPSLCPSQT